MIYDHRQTGGVTRMALWGGSVAALLWTLIQYFALGYPWRMASGSALVGGILGLAAVAFDSLTVQIDAQALRLWFGPGWLWRNVSRSEIASARVVRNTWCHGWGIHRTREGWVYNISGFDAVEVSLRDGRRLRIGTDDPAGLVAALGVNSLAG